MSDKQYSSRKGKIRSKSSNEKKPASVTSKKRTTSRQQLQNTRIPSESSSCSNRSLPKNSHASSLNKNKKRRRKKKKIALRITMIILFTLILLVATCATIFFKSVNSMNIVNLDNSNLGISDNTELQKYEQISKIKNIMLFGIDAEEVGGSGRSDSMMLITIDPKHNKLKVTSFMRDSCVAIDGYGDEDKLTHAYAYGGPELALKTINETFGLNVEDFVSVDFATLPKVIDLLGGVDIDITSEELTGVNEVINGSNYTLKKNTPLLTTSGIQTLSGDQVLAYTRNRSSEGGDFTRTQRQRIVLESLFKKALSTPAVKYPGILNTVMPLITTSMTSSDILKLGSSVLSIGNGQLQQARFPLDEYSWGDYGNDDRWYLFFDKTATKQQIQDYIFDDKLPVELSN